VNVGLIALNVLVFFYELTLSERRINEFFFDYGVVPKELTDWLESPSGLEEPLTVVTAAFVHGGWLHLFGNMVYLWVFGDNIEDSLGHVKYVVFYLVAAAGAVAAQVAIDTSETIPMVGASGAIAGVLGAYLVLYPKATIGTLIGYIFYVPIPAIFLIGFWFVMQLFSGVATLGNDTLAQEGGVAFFAHIGGFATGFAVALALRPFVRTRPVEAVRRRRSVW
jgi:membrane associated rhomboid family serine protease